MMTEPMAAALELAADDGWEPEPKPVGTAVTAPAPAVPAALASAEQSPSVDPDWVSAVPSKSHAVDASSWWR